MPPVVPNVKLTPDVSLIAAPLEPAAPPALSSLGPAAGDCSLSPPTPPVCPPAWSSLSPPPPPFPPASWNQSIKIEKTN